MGFFMTGRTYFITLFALIAFISTNLLVQAQSEGWKMISKTAGEAEYIGNLRIVKSNSGINTVHYTRVIEYNPPKLLPHYGAQLPASRLKEHGKLDCYSNSYNSNIEGLFDKNGKIITAQKLWQFKASNTPIKKGSFQDKVYNTYCEPQKVAIIKQQLDQQQATLNQKAQNTAKQNQAQQEKLKQLYQSRVKDYGTISLVESCAEIGRKDCDYRVLTSFKVYGNLPKGVSVGQIPVFHKANTLYLKNNQIIKVEGDGKEKDVIADYKKRWKTK